MVEAGCGVGTYLEFELEKLYLVIGVANEDSLTGGSLPGARF